MTQFEETEVVVDKEPILDYEDGLKVKKQTVARLKGPQDSFHIVYMIMMLLGVGTLLPWNMFITAHAYFQAKLASEESLKHEFENYFAVAAMVPNVLAFLLNTLFKHHVPLKLRMVLSIVIIDILFVGTAIMVKVDTTEWTNEFFLLTLATVVLVNIANAIFQSGLFGLSGMMPPKYTQAVMAGQGIGGTFSALASIFSIMGAKSDLESGFGYFMSAVAVLTLCIIGCLALYHIEYSKTFLKAKRPDKGTIPEEQTRRLAHWDHASWQGISETKSSKFVSNLSLNIGASDFVHPSTGKAISQQQEIIVKSKKKPFKHSISDDPRKQRPPFLAIFKRIWRVGFSVSIIFFITLACFPALTSKIQSVEKADKSDWSNKYFIPVTCFLLFNLGDLCGRVAAGFVQWPGPHSIFLPLLAFLRAGFMPLFVFCNIYRRKNPSLFFFNKDEYFIAIMALFGMSNGYLGSVSMMYGPGLVDPKHAETAGTMMAFLLMLGLASGAGFSFVLTTQI